MNRPDEAVPGERFRERSGNRGPAAGRRHFRGGGKRVAVFAAAVLLLASPACSAAGREFSGRVVGVSDGDTVKVMHGGRAERVRLHGVDAPEMGQPFGQSARRFTSEKVFDRVVTVRVLDRDDYGRTVGEVLGADGVSLNRELVRAGLAWWYRRHAPGDEELRRLEEGARERRLGLWADSRPIPPWDWRRRKSATVPREPALLD